MCVPHLVRPTEPDGSPEERKHILSGLRESLQAFLARDIFLYGLTCLLKDVNNLVCTGHT